MTSPSRETGGAVHVEHNHSHYQRFVFFERRNRRNSERMLVRVPSGLRERSMRRLASDSLVECHFERGFDAHVEGDGERSCETDLAVFADESSGGKAG